MLVGECTVEARCVECHAGIRIALEIACVIEGKGGRSRWWD